MEKSQFRKIQKTLSLGLQEVEKELIEEGIDLTSDEAEQVLQLVKEKILTAFGLDLKTYKILRASFEKVKPVSYKELVDIPEVKIPTKEEIQSFAREVIPEIPAPVIKTEIVKETTKIVEKPQVIKTTERVELDTKQLDEVKKDVSYLQESFLDFLNKTNIEIGGIKDTLPKFDLKEVNIKKWKDTDDKLNLVRQTISRNIWDLDVKVNNLRTDFNNFESSENLFDRTSTVLSPHTAGDSLDMGAGAITTSGLGTFGSALIGSPYPIRINGDGWASLEMPDSTNWSYNLYHEGSDYKYRANGGGFLFGEDEGDLSFWSAPVGVAGNAATVTPRWTMKQAGDLVSGLDGTGTGNITTTGLGTFGSLKATGLTSGRIPIVTTGGLLTDDAGLTYDAANNRLAIGANPSSFAQLWVYQQSGAANSVIESGDNYANHRIISFNNDAWFMMQDSGTADSWYVGSDYSNSQAFTIGWRENAGGQPGDNDFLRISTAGDTTLLGDLTFTDANPIISSSANSSTIYLKTKTAGGVVKSFYFDPDGIFVAPNSFRSYLNGSDSVGSGANIGLLNTAGTIGWLSQLSASNHLDFWYNDGVSWTQHHRFENDGDVVFGGAGTFDGTLSMYFTTASLYANGLSSYKRGTIGDANASVVTDTELGYHNFYGWDGSAYGRGAYALTQTTENWSGTAHGAKYIIAVTPNGSTTNAIAVTVNPDSTTTFAGTATVPSLALTGIPNTSITGLSSSPYRGVKYDAGGSAGGWYGVHDFYTGYNGAASALTMRIMNGNVGIGTTDLDGTPPIGRLTIKGTTNDGTTNILVGRDSDEANVFSLDSNGAATFSGDVTVPDEAYGAGWNGSLEVPTKNAVYDKIETMGATPSGTLVMFAGSSTPTGWLLCNGQAVSRTTYADLFTAIGTTWGAGDGSTTFNVPDLRDAYPVGANATALGGSVGANTKTIAAANLPASGLAFSATTGTESATHTHSYNDVTAGAVVAAGADIGQVSGETGTESATHTHNVSGTTANMGSGTAFNVQPASKAVNFIIKI